MRAWVMSDLHVDAAAYPLPPTPTEVDVIIIAGDVADGHERSATWLGEHAVPRGLPVIFVLGNHDLTGYDIDDDQDGLYRDAGVELLHVGRRSIEIAGARIIGLTLWTDYAIAGSVDAARGWARREMPDFSSIDIGYRRLSPRDLGHFHTLHRELIEMDLKERFKGPTVVMTHHAPHPESTRGWPAVDASDASFASDLSEMIQRYQPELWIHGHVHESRDYRVGKTRVLCNPRGYDVINGSGKPVRNPTFDRQLVIEV